MSKNKPQTAKPVPTEPRVRKPKFLRLLPALLAVVLCSAIYLPTLKYGFVWDDSLLITDNRNLELPNPLQLFAQGFMHTWTSEGYQPDQYYRPLVVLSIWLDHRLGDEKDTTSFSTIEAGGKQKPKLKKNPKGYHLTNVIQNTIANILVVIVLGELFVSGWAVLLGGIAFALHPMHTESVAFIAGRTDIMMAIFILIAFWALLKYRQSKARGSAKQGAVRGWLVLMIVAFVAALLSKEAAVLFPLLVIAYPGAGTRGQAVMKKEKNLYILLGAITISYLVIRMIILKGYTLPWHDVTIVQRALLIINGFGHYLFSSFVPFVHHTVYPDAVRFATLGWKTIVGITGLVLLPGLAWRYRNRPLGLGAFWYLAFTLPACNFFSPGASYIAERILYLPILGLIISLLYLGLRAGQPRTKILLTIAAFLYFASFAYNVWQRTPVWTDSKTLSEQLVREAPEYPQAYYNLGIALKDAGDRKGAAEMYRRALTINPEYTEVRENLAVLEGEVGMLDSAVYHLRYILKQKPGHVATLVNLGIMFAMGKQYDSAQVWFWKAIRAQPGLQEAYVNLGKLYRLIGKPDSAEIVERMYRRR